MELPELKYWRYDPCGEHEAPWPGCPRCGVILREHQQTGAAWMYLAGRAGLFDATGTGKTPQVAAVLAMCAETGELGPERPGRRALVVCRAAAVGQWQRELGRMIPDIGVVALTGDRASRARALEAGWDVALIGPEMLVNRRAGGIGQLLEFEPGIVVADDIDTLRNDNKTSRCFRRLQQAAERVIIATATPVHKRLTELYDLAEPLGSHQVFGPRQVFQHRHVEMRQVWYTPRYKPTRCQACKAVLVAKGREWVDKETGRPGVCPRRPPHPHLPVSKMEIGPKFHNVEAGPVLSHLEEFKARLAVLAVRRTAASLGGAVPAVVPQVVTLDPTEGQRARYEELRRGVLRMIDQGGREITRPQAEAVFLRGQQICSGLATLDAGRDDSAKMDEVCAKLDGDLCEEKAVVFIYFRPNVEAMSGRLKRMGIGHELIWGEERDPAERDRRIRRFTEDEGCRVLVGTTSMEASLNLQAARYMLCVDTIMNPARMTQLAGRVARIGSPFPTVYVIMYRLRGTQEDRYGEVLGLEQGIHDDVFGEKSALFASVTPLDLVRMIAGSVAA